MADSFEIPVTYRGEDLLIPAEIVVMGFTHRIRLSLNDIDVYLERDEEQRYRAIIPGADEPAGRLDKGLIAEIINVLDTL